MESFTQKGLILNLQPKVGITHSQYVPENLVRHMTYSKPKYHLSVNAK